MQYAQGFFPRGAEGAPKSACLDQFQEGNLIQLLFLGNLIEAFYNFLCSAAERPCVDLVQWRSAEVRFIYYGARRRLSCPADRLVIVTAIGDLEAQRYVGLVVRGLGRFANAHGRLFAWPALLMVPAT